MKSIILATLLLSAGAFADVRVTELKAEIMELARASEGRPDVDGKLQAALEAKVQDLEKVIPVLTMPEKAQKILGAWRQVFGPYSATGDGTIPFGSRTDKIYQVIFPQGLFYNVALFQKGRAKAVFLLKGKYAVTDESIKGTFVRNSLQVRNVDETALAGLPARLEARDLSVINLPESVPPVGQGGDLFEVYADADVRILRGMTPQFKRPALYVMERAR